MPKQDPFTLEERVEMLEKRVRRIQWAQQIDWNNIAWVVLMLFGIIAECVLILFS